MGKIRDLPSQEVLSSLFRYEPETGVLFWRVRRKGVNPSMIAGVLSRGYIVVRINGVLFRAHRIIWKLVTGDDPEDLIDHEDLDRSNNRWGNLRQADNSKNMMNAGLSVANTSGVKGVVWDRGAWSVRVKINQQTHYFGRFKDLEEAKSKVLVERERLHGEFARAA